MCLVPISVPNTFHKTAIEIIICNGVEYIKEEKLIISDQFHNYELT